MLGGRGPKRGLPPGVRRAHAPDMPEQVPARHELRQRRLVEEGRVDAGEKARRGHAREQPLGDDEIAQAERREQHLAEACRRRRPARRCRGCGAMESAAPRSGTRCRSRPPRSRRRRSAPSRAAPAARSRGIGGAERELVGGRGVHQPHRLRRSRRAPPTSSPSASTPDRHDPGTRRLHRRARAEVTRVLRRDGVARIGEQPRARSRAPVAPPPPRSPGPACSGPRARSRRTPRSLRGAAGSRPARRSRTDRCARSGAPGCTRSARAATERGRPRARRGERARSARA